MSLESCFSKKFLYSISRNFAWKQGKIVRANGACAIQVGWSAGRHVYDSRILVFIYLFIYPFIYYKNKQKEKQKVSTKGDEQSGIKTMHLLELRKNFTTDRGYILERPWVTASCERADASLNFKKWSLSPIRKKWYLQLSLALEKLNFCEPALVTNLLSMQNVSNGRSHLPCRIIWNKIRSYNSPGQLYLPF